MALLDGIFGSGGKETRKLNVLDPPNVRDLQVQLEPYTFGGEVTPQDAATIDQDPSAYDTISEDPRLRGSQLGTLDELEEIALAGGLDARARASLEEALGAQRTAQRGANDAILANSRARGIGGSGLETVSRLVAGQGAATRGAELATQSAADAEGRRIGALNSAAQLAGGIRNQDYQRSSDRAAANDVISRFNAGNQQNQINRNVGARNEAQAINTRERQRISDQNVDTRNTQERTNRRLPLDIFGLQQGAQDSRNDRDLLANQQDEQRKKKQADVALGAVQAIGSYFSDERTKDDVEPLDSRDMLDELEGYTYDYEDPSMGEGEQIGVMADDLERSPLKGAVQQDPETGLKKVDGGLLAGQMTGLMADMNARISELEDMLNAQ